jgi:hypothetical protein
MLQFRRGDLLRMRFFWLCGFGAVRPGVVHVIRVELAGVSARSVSGAPRMIRRLRHGTKADTGDGTTTHTGHDDQSETDSQSQFSEETNTAPQVLSSKRKAPVCTDKDSRWSPSKLLRYCRINAASIQRHVSCFHSESYVTIII